MVFWEKDRGVWGWCQNDPLSSTFLALFALSRSKECIGGGCLGLF